MSDPYADEWGYGMDRLEEASLRAAHNPTRDNYLSGTLAPRDTGGWRPDTRGHDARSSAQRDQEKLDQIRGGICPRAGCGSGTLDEEYYCSGCGFVSLPFEPKEAAA